MPRSLLIWVQLHDRRYHGRPEWPPSPARLFQALVAGAAEGSLQPNHVAALEWLETLDPPSIWYPHARNGQQFQSFVPNNDLDAVGGDPARIADVRAAKTIQPRLTAGDALFCYEWSYTPGESGESFATGVAHIAEALYQFGRGVDMAWARAELIDETESRTRAESWSGTIHRPSPGGAGDPLPCPAQGSLFSLIQRHQGVGNRFRLERHGRTARQLFSQPPKARFRQVPYDSPCSRRTYAIHAADSNERIPWPLRHAHSLAVSVRDAIVSRLINAVPELESIVNAAIIGRKADGSNDGPAAERVRILPLPSIGAQYTNQQIRRIVIEVPPACRLRPGDVHWACSGLEFPGPISESRVYLQPDDDPRIPAYYGIGASRPHRTWRTVTPAALPIQAARRRIDPSRIHDEPKPGSERAAEESRAAAAVVQALRHAGVPARAESIRVQREPFDGRGLRAEAFAAPPRFNKERLWHVAVTLSEPVSGPVVIGDGRFLGYGIMRHDPAPPNLFAFAVESGLTDLARPEEIARALRRALLARVQQTLGPGKQMPSYFSGHEPDGSPARGEGSDHVFCIFDPSASRILILPPHVVAGTPVSPTEKTHLATLESALLGFDELRAGVSGLLRLRPSPVELATDPLFKPSAIWKSSTDYVVTRHAKTAGPEGALLADIQAECCRRNLPESAAHIHQLCGVPRLGLTASLTLTFPRPISGPILLGKTRHLGGGLFSPEP
ncbi:MAG: type I-U CRISPR-associated protein Csb2 [Bryobacteraceae bacterium]